MAELVERARTLHFNFEGVKASDFVKYMLKIETGHSNFTNWEIKHIATNPTLWRKLIIYLH